MRWSDDRLAIRGVPIAGETPALQEEGLLDDAEFSAAVFGPSRIVARGIGGHFAAEAHGLNAVALDAGIDQSLADGLRPALAEAAAAVSRPMPQVAAETLQRRAETLSPAELVGLLRLTVRG